MRMRLVLSLAIGAALTTGLVACGGGGPTQPQDQAAALCGSTDITGGAELPGPQFSCAAASKTTVPGAQWGSLQGTLCLTEGIPPAGLNGFTCTDPSDMKVTVHEMGRQRYTTTLVRGASNPSDPLGLCLSPAAGEIVVGPGETSAQDSTTFTITQETADFVYGNNVPAPLTCSVVITDGHGQQILVNIGIQVYVNCKNASCTGSASPIAPDATDGSDGLAALTAIDQHHLTGRAPSAGMVDYLRMRNSAHGAGDPDGGGVRGVVADNRASM